MLGELEEVISTIGGQGLGKLHPFAKRLAAKRDELQSRKTEELNNIAGKPTESSGSSVAV